MKNLSLIPIILANGTVVIDANGEVRELASGELPAPGEVIVYQDANSLTVQSEIVQSNGQTVPIDQDVAAVLQQIEAGADPTLNEELAPAAGEDGGSSPTVTGSIARDGSETIAATNFDTEGFEALGLSETQSLGLLELVSATNLQLSTLSGFNFNYAENSSDDIVIGVVTATDPEGLPVTYSIDYPDGDPLTGLFEINNDGEITLTPAGVEAFTNDFELAGNTHVITVVASDGVNETPITVTLNETDVNEPPVFDPPGEGDEYIFSYNENSLDGDVIGTVNAEDPEGGEVTYSIDYPDGDPLTGLFEINGDGQISLTPAGVDAFTNDYELASNSHVITVVASDGVNDVPITVTLNELDVNEPPVFDPPGEGDEYIFSYNENSLDGDVIGTVNAEDPEGGEVTYSIDYPDGDPLTGLFEINADGQISLTPAGVDAFTNDYELASNSHVITVVASDGVNDVPITVTLNELDVNEPPVFDPPSQGDEYIFSYNENSLDGDVIGTVNAEDPEGSEVTYSIDYPDGDPLTGLFEINGDGQISLTPAGVDAFTNDYELASNSHVITVVASDGVNDVPITVTLNELDVNEPPVFDPPGEGDEYIFSYNENSLDGDVIGTVNAEDPEGSEVTYSIDYPDGDPLTGLFEINADGQISLTPAGVDAFTNDYELASNSHVITVVASDGVNDVPITVTLNELDVNEPPVFDPPGEGDDYIFSYNENSLDGDVIGTVNAEDPEGGEVTYSIDYPDGDPLTGLFEINADGQISLTPAGVDAFTNDYELGSNSHVITVVSSDGVNDVSISVTLNELNVNEPPVAEDFIVDAEDLVVVPVKFDSLIESEDHISDVEDDLNNVQVQVMITSLPDSGTLIYTDEDGVTRKITEQDLHEPGTVIDPDKLFNPDNISYVPGEGEEFEIGYSGDPENIVLEDGFYNWGEYVSDTERLVTLENGNTIGISIEDNNGKPLKQYTNGQPHVGYGIGDTDGQGMNKQEKLIIDLTNNPLAVVTLGLDGMGGAFIANSNVYVEVNYILADGTIVTKQYQKDEGDVGNDQILYEFTYSSPDNPVVGIELSGTGGNWELRYISGNQNMEEEVTFDYIAVDSDMAESNEAEVTIDTSDSAGFEVIAAASNEELEAAFGNELLIGDDGENIFTWLDNTLDSGTDIISDFTLSEDLINFDDILDDTNSADIDELIAKIGVEIVDDDIELLIPHEDGNQTIVLENGANILDEYIAPDNSFDSIELLAQIIKNDAA